MARVHTDPSRITMEDILQETGWGLYYKVLIGVVSACNFCQAVSLVALSFALPLGTCDPFINEATILTVDMCFFFGKAIGGFLLNASSDVTGRLWLLPNSLMMVFCSTFLAAFSHTGSTLSVAMFILGSGLEANIHATRIHLAEILPKHTRGRHLITPNFFWTLGYMIATASAWKLSHHAIVDHRGSDMRLTAWRLMFAVAGGCNIIVACVTALVQPSPRYRLFRKQFDLAQSSLKLFYAINKSKYSETWPHRVEDLTNIISDFQINTEPQPLNCGEQIRLLLRRTFKTICLLFKRRFISTTVTLIIMRILLFSGGYRGMVYYFNCDFTHLHDLPEQFFLQPHLVKPCLGPGDIIASLRTFNYLSGASIVLINLLGATWNGFLENSLSRTQCSVPRIKSIVPVHLMLSKALLVQNGTCEVIGHELLHLFPPIGQKCILEVDFMLFIIFISLTLNILAGQIIVFITVDRIGRIFTLVVGLVTCSMCAYCIAYWEMQLSHWIPGGFYVKCMLCSIFLMGYSITQHILDILEIETYPTASRGAAAGVMNFYPNFIFCVVCTLWYMPCQITYIALGLTISAAVMVTYFLPEMKKRTMVE